MDNPPSHAGLYQKLQYISECMDIESAHLHCYDTYALPRLQ